MALAPGVVTWSLYNLDFTSVLWGTGNLCIMLVKESENANQDTVSGKNVHPTCSMRAIPETVRNHLSSETDSPLCLQLENAWTVSSQMKNVPRPIQRKKKFHFILATVRRGWRKTQLIDLSTCCFESFVIIPLCSFWCLLTFCWLILPHHCWILLLLTSWQRLPKLMCEQQDNKPRDVYLYYFEKIRQYKESKQ